MGWLIAGSILGFLALLITVILMLPVYVHLEGDESSEPVLYLKFLWLRIEQGDNPDSALVKAAKQIVGVSKFEDLKTIRKTLREESVSVTLKRFTDVLGELLRQVLVLLRQCTLHRVHIQALIASEDAAQAAMEYGAVCALTYPLFGYFKKLANMKKQALKCDFQCAYDHNNSTFSFNVVLSVRVLRILQALLRLIRENIRREVYK